MSEELDIAEMRDEIAVHGMLDYDQAKDLINRLKQAERAVARVREVAAHRKDIRLDYILLNDLTRALDGEQS